MIYPRVLIIGETFRLNGGGGITMTNLFKDWPEKNIGVVTDLIAETDPETKYLYYQLGREEIKFPFPYYFLQTYFLSGPYSFGPENEHNISNNTDRNIMLILKKKIRPYFDDILNRIGMFSFFYKIKLSDTLKNWILDFKPDIIYVQPFYHKMMCLGILLYEELNINYVIHIMDDSVKYINKSIIFRKAIQHRIEKDFAKLISNARVLLCISEAMSEEYLNRYGKSFIPFRNPIDVNNWVPYQRRNLLVNSEQLKIIYTGRPSSPTLSSLIDLCKVVDRLNGAGKKIDLHIYTHDKNPSFLQKIRKLKGISLLEPVNIREIPQLVQQYDIFFICLDFDNEARKYSQFSISTRTSEGMISAVPVLVYAPSGSALHDYFVRTDSGCIVEERNSAQLEMAILKLWHDQTYRERISKNAVRTALADSDSSVIREKFRKTLTINENGKES